jgi:hypothetical protein
MLKSSVKGAVLFAGISIAMEEIVSHINRWDQRKSFTFCFATRSLEPGGTRTSE